jgi:tryptophan halogenase
MSVHGALIAQDRCFARNPNGRGPEITGAHAYHLENVKFVQAMTTIATEWGIEILDGKLREAELGEQGIKALHLEDGRKLDGDFFIDASGFGSQLLGKALAEPYISFSSSLFNDRAIVGNWNRDNDHDVEPILPYTTAETMDAGWCWRIEHEHAIHRGYVYSSASISDDTAREEFLRKNPKATTWERPVHFKSGRYNRCWVKNVMAIGNAGGFVEPLESTGLMVIAGQCVDFVNQIMYIGITPKVQEFFNAQRAKSWDTIRDFLTLHFWANTRLSTPYWQHVRHDTNISGIQPLLDAYTDMGPTQLLHRLGYAQDIFFGLEGFLCMLVGNKVPYKNIYTPTDAERNQINTMRARNEAIARNGYTVREALDVVKHPGWQWHRDVVNRS